MRASTELDRALQDIGGRLQLSRRTRSSSLFRAAVEAWCEQLDWPMESAQYGIELDRDQAAHLGRLAFAFDTAVKDRKEHGSLQEQGHQALRKVAKKVPFVGQGLQVSADDYFRAHDEAMSKMEARDYLLIALAVAAAGYVVYRLTRRPTQPADAVPPRAAVAPTHWVLVLVVNAGRDSVLDAVRTGGVVALDGDQLYQATQALWLGKETDFERLSLGGWFSEERAVAEPSEYDVHLIRIDIAGDDPGLHRNANQMDRLDAFRRFQSMGFKATVSPRLPSDAYGTTDVYSR